MVFRWRRAFCTSIPKDQEYLDSSNPRLTSRFSGFFSTSNPSTPPRLHSKIATTPQPQIRAYSAPQSPTLECKPTNRSATSSPRSPFTFSLLRSTICFSKSRCGICLHRVKTGQGTAIFTAECGHSFHFPCIAAHIKKQKSLACPLCSSAWKEMHLLPTDSDQNLKPYHGQVLKINDKTRCTLKVYNDDEPLSSLASGARFNPIPESDEENEEFPGFFPVNPSEIRTRNVEISLLPEAAAVSVGRRSETHAVVLKIKAPAAPVRRAPIDLVTVLNVSRSVTAEKLHMMKRAMRMVVSSLSAADRLSIVAFSTTSKRLLPLRRMNGAGRRAARRITDAIVSLDGGATSSTEALQKAAKVIEDRREKNETASIILFSDGHQSDRIVTSTRFSNSDIPLHSMNLNAWLNTPSDCTIAKCVTSLLSVVIEDLKIQLGFKPCSSMAEITAVYSYNGKPAFLGSGWSWFRVGTLHSEEEREILIELKVPSLSCGAHQRLLSIRCCYNDPLTQQPIYDKEQLFRVPSPRAVGSFTRDSERLRSLLVMARAVTESRRLVARNDVAAAQHVLASARTLILQTGSDKEFVCGLEHELKELKPRRRNKCEREGQAEKTEPVTPTSAWRAAERLAKVAITRKSLNRVSDLHGFEDARF